MGQRKEILEAIKDGTITPEEGLLLLEEIEAAEATHTSEPVKEASLQPKHEPEHEPAEKAEPAIEVKPESSSEPDLEPELAPEPETQPPHDPIASLIDEWEANDHQQPAAEPTKPAKKARPESAKKENDSLAKLNAIDQQIQPLADTLKAKQEIFRNLNLEVELEIISQENLALYEQTKKEIAGLEAEIKLLKQQKATVEKEFYSIPVWQTEIPKYEEVPEETWAFEEEPAEQPASSFNSRLNQLVNRTLKTVADTVDGTFDEIKLPGAGSVGNTKFEEQFTFREKGITDLDIKLANGTVILETWSRSDIYVEAEIVLHGKMYGQDPLEAFMERSQIEANEDQLLFHVPNKRVTAELTFYLPEKLYDHVQLRLLNGDLIIQEMTAKDVFIKATNGDLIFKNINAGVLEIQGTKNEIEIYAGTINDAIIETANGSIVSKAEVTNFDASLVNGQIRLTAGNSDLQKIKADSVNGTIKISLPTTIGLEGVAKTSLGEINYRLSDFQTVRERRDAKERLFHFRRPMESAAQIEVSSKTGSIFLKDFDR